MIPKEVRKSNSKQKLNTQESQYYEFIKLKNKLEIVASAYSSSEEKLIAKRSKRLAK